jgi:hypothetical protein
MRVFAELVLVCTLAGLIVAALFVMTIQPLAPMSIWEMAFWLLAALIFFVSLTATLILVDLKRAFGAVPGVSLVATLFYVLVLWSPALTMSHYSTHLLNYALVQSVPVFLITVVLAAVGAMAGTFINNSIREFDL